MTQIPESQTEGKKPQGADIIVTKFGADAQALTDLTALIEGQTDVNHLTDADVVKFDGIETGATADQTGAEIKTAYEAEANAYTDTKDTKLTGIETAATADQSDAEIKTAYENNADTNEFSDAEQTSLATMADQEIITQVNYDLLSPPVAGRMYLVIG